MTVHELIEKLRAFPSDMPVVCYDDDYAIADLVVEPRVMRVFRLLSVALLEGEPDVADRIRGASEPFDVVALGIAP